jgi:hypothetical protein
MGVRRLLAICMAALAVAVMLISAARIAECQSLQTTKDYLMMDKRFSRVLLDHDQDVLKFYAARKRLAGRDAESSLSDAWFKMRIGGKLAPNVGITYGIISSFYEANEPVVFDSAPRGARVIISPVSESAPKTTPATWNLRTGQTFRIHFSKSGYQDSPEETITVTKDMPVVCRELKPLSPSMKAESCPKP